jgi:HPt (histidine-containing phosphotransfer) domain-containing protein
MPQGNNPSTPDSGQYQIDRTALKRLRDDCGDDIVEVVAVFADELQGFLDDMDAAAAAGDLVRLCGTALSIRGCAATFGLHNVRQASAGLEAACRMGKPSQARQISAELHSAADEALKALRSEFPTRLT